MTKVQQPRPPHEVRQRILAVARRLVAEGGVESATTRAVAEGAGVQAPTIYRLFGDKAGLLEAVAEQALADFVAGKARRAHSLDPVADLAHAWDNHIAFNLAHPAVFLLGVSRPGEPSKAAVAGLAVLAAQVHRIAIAGRLRVTEERAVALIHSMGAGALLTMLKSPPDEQESLSLAARNAIFTAVITDTFSALDPGLASAASALRARLPETTALSAPERSLLAEWLERIAREG